MKRALKITLGILMCLCIVGNNKIAKAEENTDIVMVKGTDFQDKVSKYLYDFDDVKTIKFVTVNTLPNEGINLDLDNNGNIKGYVDGDTLYICVKTGNIIKFNQDCSYMFATFSDSGEYDKLSYIEKIDFNDGVIDTTAVTIMSNMFYGCHELKEINFGSNFNTSKVTTMEGMFCDCWRLLALDLSGFSSAELKNTKLMFSTCLSLGKIIFGYNFTCSNVENMERMFSTCISLVSLNFTNIDTANAKNADRMFQGCVYLTRIYVYEGVSYFSQATTDEMFYKCYSIVGQNATEFDETHTSGEYARLDEPGNPGYFTDINKSIQTNKAIEYDENMGFYSYSHTGFPMIISPDNLSYDPDTQVVTMKDLLIDSDLAEGLTLVLPEGTNEIRIEGDNVITNINESYGYPIISYYNDEHSIRLTGKGKLILNNVSGNNTIYAKDIVVDGPTLDLYSYQLSEIDDGTIGANSLTINRGKIITHGPVGIELLEYNGKLPKLTINGGTIDATGIQAGLLVKSSYPIYINAKIKGSTTINDDSYTSLIYFGKLESPENATDYTYKEVGSNETIRHIILTKADNPEPEKKDESCEKVIGPTWHWNNKKGICEDAGSVHTYTK